MKTTGHYRHLLAAIALLVVAVFSLAPLDNALAGSGTWIEHPEDNAWFNAHNWSSNSVPNGLNDVATFGPSATAQLFGNVSQDFAVAEIDFTTDASPYAITIDLPVSVSTVDGTGVINSSANIQLFHLQDGTRFNFVNNSTAGDQVTYVIDTGSQLNFVNTSTAGTAQINVDDAALSFDDSSTAGEATITNTASVTLPGTTSFSNASNGANATLIAMGGPVLGGGIFFFEGEAQGTSGGTCKVQVFDNGALDISPAALANGGFDIVTVGSLSGDGLVFLGSDNLTVGSDNSTTSFSGTIQDGGAAGRTGGSLTKIGSGNPTLSGNNTYTGGTTVNAGTLLVKNRGGSATGTGQVQVSAGSLSGKGTIAGAVTIGTGDGAGAYLVPGSNSSAATTTNLQSTLTFKADGTYSQKINTGKMLADKVIANGVIIESGARFTISVVGNKSLPVGTVFLAISNTSAAPIGGTFANLPDGAVFKAHKIKYQASYSGGDGNDLSLTTVR